MVLRQTVSVTPGSSITVTIGAGGVGATQNTASGGNSSFGSLTAQGGGGGAYWTGTGATAGFNGGSGYCRVTYWS
jgi:hypothetical protein